MSNQLLPIWIQSRQLKPSFFLLGPESWQQVTVDPEEENLFLPQSQCQPNRHC